MKVRLSPCEITTAIEEYIERTLEINLSESYTEHYMINDKNKYLHITPWECMKQFEDWEIYIDYKKPLTETTVAKAMEVE